jgi:hypothetical protein
MVEYGRGVGTATDVVGGTGGGTGGGAGVDAGGNLVAMASALVNDASAASGLPPIAIVALAALLLVGGLIVLRRAL